VHWLIIYLHAPSPAFGLKQNNGPVCQKLYIFSLSPSFLTNTTIAIMMTAKRYTQGKPLQNSTNSCSNSSANEKYKIRYHNKHINTRISFFDASAHLLRRRLQCVENALAPQAEDKKIKIPEYSSQLTRTSARASGKCQNLF
jgi:hypothetical protein